MRSQNEVQGRTKDLRNIFPIELAGPSGRIETQNVNARDFLSKDDHG